MRKEEQMSSPLNQGLGGAPQQTKVNQSFGYLGGDPEMQILPFGPNSTAGDTCLFSDMRLIGEEGLDVAVIPIGDAFTMGPADARRAVEFLSPKAVIPCHFNTFPLIAQDAGLFKREVEERTGARVEPLEPGATIDLSGV